MLLREDRRRHEHGDLLAVLHRLERGPDRDLGLAVADVTADQPVHRHRLLHVVLDVVHGGELVGGLHVGERVLELALPRRVRPERVPGRRHPRRVQPDQLGGDLADRLPRPALGLGPVRAAEPVQGGRLAADVPGDLVELVGRHVQPVRRVPALVRRVFNHQVVAGGPRGRPRGHLDEPADAVLLVHHVVARLELQRVDPAAPPRGRHPPLVPRGRTRGTARGEVRLGEHREPHGRPGEPLAQLSGRDVGHPALGLGVEVADARAESFAAQHLGEPLGGPVPLGDEDHPPAFGEPVANVREHAAGLAAVGRRRRGVNGDPERKRLTLLRQFLG